MKPLLVAATLVMLSSPTLASIYKCKSPSGTTIYREVPCETAESKVEHKIVAPEPSASPARKVSPAKEKVNSSAASRSGGAPSRSQAQATSSGDIDARMCQGFRRRYEEARNMPCIMAVQEGTGKQMCMPEAHRTAFIANLQTLVKQNCP